MKFHPFTPKPSKNYKRVATYSMYKSSPVIKEEADAYEAALKGTKKRTYEQSAWMGRGCFRKMKANAGYIMGKGVGPGPGSEEMRELLKGIWEKRAHPKKGGCVRMNTDTYYPLLLQYKQVDGGWDISDPRPEGFSIFGAVLRESETSELYKKLGIQVVAPVSIFRNNVTPPWKNIKDKRGLESFIKNNFAHVFSNSSLESEAKPKDVSVSALVESGYWEYDGGTLLRHAHSPYRIVNLHFATIDNNRSLLKELTKHTRDVLNKTEGTNKRGRDADIILVQRLGRMAGQMLSHGIIHGLLHIHYQNVSVAGELADLDASIFLRAMLKDSKDIPLPSISASQRKLFDRYIPTIEKLEKKHKLKMTPYIYTDLKTYTGGKSVRSVDHAQLGMYMLGQIYDLYNHALKAYDLLGRADAPNILRKGTILSKQDIKEVREAFITSMLEQIEKLGASDTLIYALKHGRKKLVKTYLDKKAPTSIYGWHKAGTPANHLLVPYDDVRIAFTRKDATDLMNDIEAHLTTK